MTPAEAEQLAFMIAAIVVGMILGLMALKKDVEPFYVFIGAAFFGAIAGIVIGAITS